MFDFKDNLLKRALNMISSRKLWDEKINYSYNNYIALNAIGEIRLNLFSLLIGCKPSYSRNFN